MNNAPGLPADLSPGNNILPSNHSLANSMSPGGIPYGRPGLVSINLPDLLSIIDINIDMYCVTILSVASHFNNLVGLASGY